MTPQIVACYEGELYSKLARVLEQSAIEHAPSWHRRIVRVAIGGGIGKLSFWLAAVESVPEGTPMLLTDCDAMVTGPLDDVWDQPFDLAYTVRDSTRSPWPYNSGVIFVRACAAVRAFLRAWAIEAKRRVDKPKDGKDRVDDRAKFGASEQAAFHVVLQGLHGQALRTVALPCRIWNCEDSEWGRFGPETRLVHVKGAFRDAIVGKPIRATRKAAVTPLLKEWKRLLKASTDQVTQPAELYSPEWQEGRQRYMVQSLQCFERTLSTFPAASVLDVGSGLGHLVRRAQTCGLDAVGVDLTETAPEGPLRHADLCAPVDLERQFELVLCWEVAEHLPAEAADTLCDTLVRHLTPEGVLVFSAALPGQGGKGHINEQPLDYWRKRLRARGLQFCAGETQQLSKQFQRAAPKAEWYGQNVQVFRRAAAMPESVPAGPIGPVVLTIRTADRSPKRNYIGGTLKRLHQQGVDLASVQVCFTSPDLGWFDAELRGLPRPTCHVPAEKLGPNLNGLAQIEAGLATGAEWIIALEDDLEFCADFVSSVTAWLQDHARADRHVFRFFGFANAPRGVSAYDWPLEKLRGSQAIAFRRADALDFVQWGNQHAHDWVGRVKWRSPTTNPLIAFDKFVAAWSLERWPGVPGVMSSPHLVNHVGDQSSIHSRGVRNDAPFGGLSYRYEGAA